jgi:hypothetical protein
MSALAQWHEDFSGSLAGSVYAASGSRVAAAQELADAELDVHIDVMAVSEGLPAGVSLAELQMISAAVDRRRIGVHLIGSADFVDAVLPKILALRPVSSSCHGTPSPPNGPTPSARAEARPGLRCGGNGTVATPRNGRPSRTASW